MNKTLIVVDMQNDFITGTLGTAEAQAALAKAAAIAAKAQAEGYTVIFTRDTHQENYLDTQEGRVLPVAHCIEGSWGWQIADELADTAKDAIIVDKPTFGSLALAQYIPRNTEEIAICGVCTDICVISNALLLKAALPETPIKIIADGCAGVSPQTHAAALTVAASCQIEIA